MAAPGVVTEDQVLASLKGVQDPELAMSIVDLGLVYGVRVEAGRVAVTLTLTAPGCPLHEVMVDWARAAVGAIPGVDRCDVTLTFDPPWSPDRIRR